MTVAFEPVAWLIAAALLVACWPLAQRLRHEKLRPVAAYLLFVSVLGLVAGGVFWALAWLFTLWGPDAALGNVAAAVIMLLSLGAGFVAGRWIIRYPQTHRMPK